MRFDKFWRWQVHAVPLPLSATLATPVLRSGRDDEALRDQQQHRAHKWGQPQQPIFKNVVFDIRTEGKGQNGKNLLQMHLYLSPLSGGCRAIDTLVRELKAKGTATLIRTTMVDLLNGEVTAKSSSEF